MKRLSVLLLLQILCVQAFAQTVDRVFTKDGALYEGYISEQVPGDSISVYAEKAAFRMENAQLRDCTENVRRYSDFTRPVQQWLKGMGSDTTFVRTTSFVYNGVPYEDMYVKPEEAGNDTLTVYSLGGRTYRILWDDILRTEKVLPEKRIPYGFRDVVTLTSGEQVSGSIASQVPGAEITIVDESGVKCQVAVDSVLSVRSEKIADAFSIWDQALLLDAIQLDGVQFETGYIQDRTMGKSITLRSRKDDSETIYDMERITMYCKVLNPDYREYAKPVKPVKDTVSYIKVNGDRISASRTVIAGKFHYAVNPVLVNVPVETELSVEMKNIRCNDSFSLYEVDLEKYKARDGSGYTGREYLAYRDADDPMAEYTPQKSGDGTLTLKLVLEDKGYYLLNFADGRGILIDVQD